MPDRPHTVGVLGGSFNPVHLGHISLAREIVKRRVVDEVWMVLSPVNPLKAASADLAPDADRWAMLQLACEGVEGVKACDVELWLPKPNYTADTLRHLSREHPELQFRLIIGADNMQIFNRWREPDYILANFTPIVYPRPGYPEDGAMHGMAEYAISSTVIREKIFRGEPVNKFLCEAVIEYIRGHGLYGMKR